jgi:hypothetical protein
MLEAFGGPCDGQSIVLTPKDARIVYFRHPKPGKTYKYEVINFGTNKVALKFRGVVSIIGLNVNILPLPKPRDD